jgi:hypothetical protein
MHLTRKQQVKGLNGSDYDGACTVRRLPLWYRRPFGGFAEASVCLGSKYATLPPHSFRNARIKSILVALRAGMKQAASTAQISNSGISVNVKGSNALTL